jgi:hypothetical protein
MTARLTAWLWVIGTRLVDFAAMRLDCSSRVPTAYAVGFLVPSLRDCSGLILDIHLTARLTAWLWVIGTRLVDFAAMRLVCSSRVPTACAVGFPVPSLRDCFGLIPDIAV